MSREWDAKAYHRISGPQLDWGRKVLERISLRGDETVLDAGCGTGKLTGELLGRLPAGRVLAVDLSQNMLHSAREYLQEDFGHRVKYVAADLVDLPFWNQFDGIFSTAAFHWVADHERLFRSLYQGLKPGGWLITQCGGGPNLVRLLSRLEKISTTPPFAPFLAHYQHGWTFSDAETAAAQLSAAGFTDIETSMVPAPTVFDTAEQYCEFVSKVILRRHLECIPDQGMQRELLWDLAGQAKNDDPPFELDYWRLNLSGQKPKDPLTSS